MKVKLYPIFSESFTYLTKKCLDWYHKLLCTLNEIRYLNCMTNAEICIDYFFNTNITIRINTLKAVNVSNYTLCQPVHVYGGQQQKCHPISFLLIRSNNISIQIILPK